MDYLEIDFKIVPNTEESREIFVAMLGELPFESFIDTETGTKGYIPAQQHKIGELNMTLDTIKPFFEEISFQQKLIEDQNWNAQWEKNFSPISVGNQCLIRAPFHNADKSYTYEIIIEPKMSFGTGHHSTTSLMIEQMLSMEFKQKNVLDMGCGTGVLAILAAKKGAHKITAIDIDEWAFENSKENTERNNTPNVDVLKGDASLLKNKKFDIILANINRNILLNDMQSYSNCLSASDTLLLSGFYLKDLEMIKAAAKQLGLVYVNHLEQNDWVAAKFTQTL